MTPLYPSYTQRRLYECPCFARNYPLILQLIAAAAALLLLPSIARADGCFIPPTAFAKVQIPDQRALIHYANGTETLVIDTSFKGDGTNFAWIIPVPSVPKVEAATTGLFPTLQELFEPEVIHYVPHNYLAALFIAVFICSFVWGKRHGYSVLKVVVFWVCMLFIASISVPMFATAGVSATETGGLQILARNTVGIYDTATLSSTNGRAVFDWLQTNGFATPTNLAPAIEAYAREGWVFVASKLRMDASLDGPTRAHPLSLTFKTPRAVYPLRLTGIGNGKCKIDLYVFGPNRAESPSFSVERCTFPKYPKVEDSSFYRGHDSVRILHPLLRSIADRSPVATKLTAELTPEGMASDAYINWSPFEEKRLTFYSSHGAYMTALNVAGSLLIAGLAVCYCFRWSMGWLGRQLVKVGICLMVIAVPAGMVNLPPAAKSTREGRPQPGKAECTAFTNPFFR